MGAAPSSDHLAAAEADLVRSALLIMVEQGSRPAADGIAQPLRLQDRSVIERLLDRLDRYDAVGVAA